MVPPQPNKNDEFLQLLAAEPRGRGGTAVHNPFDEDEIVFRDERGEIKVLKGKRVTSLDQGGDQRREPGGSPAEPLPVTPPAATTGLPSPSASIAQAATHHRQAIADAVESITANHQLKKTFAEAALEKRFKNVVLSVLTGVRNAVETRELLTRPLAEGGLEFSQQEATDVLAAITQSYRLITNQEQRQPDQPPATLSSEGQQLLRDSSATQPPKLVFTDPILKLPVAPSSAPLPPVTPPKPIAPLRPVKVQEPPVPLVVARPRPAAAAETPIGRQTAQPTGEAGSPRFVRPRLASSPTSRSGLDAESRRGVEAGRPKIEDVKFKPKSMGPVDEIGALTVLDFRRLDADPNAAVAVIMEKIELLEQESFSQRLAAIRAWQDSPVYRLYLELGGASMEEKKSVAAIIAERQAAHTPTLTEPEFEAISDFNQKLRH